MIRAVIVDDEWSAVQSLKWEVDKFCRGVEVCEVFTDPVEAVSGINYLKPDCVFLDIEMPQMDGFQLLDRLSFRNFDLIFTTAYDAYALKAFKESAIDYLLKPIDSDDLQKAVLKIQQNKASDTLGTEVKKAMGLLQGHYSSKIPLSFVDRTLFVKPSEILYCKSDGNYTEVYLVNGNREVISRKIKEMEELIHDRNFFRVHNSYLVNLKYLREYMKGEGAYLVLEGGKSIPVSRSRKTGLMDYLNG